MRTESSTERREDLIRLRIFLPACCAFAGLLLLAVTLFLEQIHAFERHRKLVSKQTLRQIRIPARRGGIYSSDLQLITENVPSFELLFFPGEMKKRRQSKSVAHMLECANIISQATGVPHQLTAVSIRRHLNTRPGLPLQVLRGLSEDKAARAMEAARGIEGAELHPMESRSYPERLFACHLIGYTRPGDPRGAADRKEYFYYQPDDIGISGVEKACDGINPDNNQPGLRGMPGYSLIQVDHLGYAKKSLIERIDPVHGNHVILTINSVMQKTAERLLQGKRGALVAVDADNGDVLVSASAPGYDLGLFSGKISSKTYTALLQDPGKPLFNRALQGVYPPGSIIKPLNMLAFLQAGVDPAQKIVCDGSSEIYGVKIRCASYRRGGHGALDMHDALKYSCNVYMIEHAKKLGLLPLQNMIRQAGFGKKSGIGLPESAGIFPTDLLKRRRTRIGWNTYDTALLSIGQGLIGVTPLQAAIYCAALANGGTVWKPNLIAKSVDSAGRDIWIRTPQKQSQLPVTQENLEKISSGMFDVVNSPDGSGRDAWVDGVEIYGKTGSAEFGRGKDLKIYAWFIAYAEVKGRNIAIAIVIEEGDSGGRTCAPIAAEFFTAVAGK